MIVNELAQWALIAFLCVFVLGLTRQLGNFLVPPREQLAHQHGPRIGDQLPSQLLGEDGRERLVALMHERNAAWCAIFVVAEDCPGCSSLLERLKSSRLGPAPIVAFARTSSPEHRRLLREVADLVIIEPVGLKEAKLLVTPFVLIVDASLTVLQKEVSPNLDDVMHDLRDPRVDARPDHQNGSKPQRMMAAGDASVRGNVL